MKRIFESKKKFYDSNFFVFLPKSQRLVSLNLKTFLQFDDLQEISDQKNIVLKNTECFLKNEPSNNILLWGAKGMGKSTLVKSVINHINNNSKSKSKVKLIEVLNNNLEHLVEIVYELSEIKSKFIIFIDDISFENNDNNFKLFKSLVEGSLLSHIKNVRYYITSNLRHLSHAKNSNNLNDIQSKEESQNLVSLSDRFGCWVGFYDPNQEQYIKIVKHYFKKLSINYSDITEKKALQWSIEKGNFSGRTAFQFVKRIQSQNL